MQVLWWSMLGLGALVLLAGVALAAGIVLYLFDF